MARKKTVATEPEQTALEMVTTPSRPHFPIVGIGASAGGLAAFEAFFSGMPADKDPGMAFVLVQHLAPDHKSILTDLIRRYTRMEVFEVVDGVEVQPNCTYIIPPNCDMAFLNGTLQLLEPSAPRGHRLPIDFFFRSLAQDQHELAICIVLSGTGSDGTMGLRSIKGEGGMAMVQVPESTEYDGMPRSAINTGLVDYILPAAEMPAQLIAYAAHAFGKPPRPATVAEPKTESELKKVFVILRAQTGHDFSLYKPSTINRRIERRMAVHQITRLDGYVKYIQQTPLEVEALFRDLLIGVTNFFRDPLAFAELKEKIIPRIFADKPFGSIIRVWICGCSTGEEAYSIAILLQEHLETLKQQYTIQLFATDIDNQAIDQARKGYFAAGIASDITPERLARFFTLEADGKTYRIQKGIRDMLIFSEQDVIKDPPFSKLDLISCRNLLIYMGGELQKKVIPLFHYALNPGGFLFLGTSETVGEFSTLFTTLERKQKLYQRKENGYSEKRIPVTTFLPPMTNPDAELRQPAVGRTFPAKVPLQELAEQALLQQVIQAGILVNRSGDILYLHGRTGMYLEAATGWANNYNILKMAREGLQSDLTIALHKAATRNEVVCRSGLRVKTNGHFTTVNLSVSPVAARPDPVKRPGIPAVSEPALFLVVLEEALTQLPELVGSGSGLAQNPVEADSTGVLSSTTDSRLAALQLELQAKEEYIRSANEEMDASKEELKSANEELQSINEEMQSTNEELETSKEELQSVNEELATINAELQTKVVDLSRVNDDMNNLLAGTGIGTVFVDFQLRILRFTPSATQIVNLILSDIGRSIAHFASNLIGYNSFMADIQTVLSTLIPKEVEVQTADGVSYMMRILPYRTVDNVIEGAVITFVNITEIVQTRERLKTANDLIRMAVVVRDSHDAVVMQDMGGNIMSWNPAAVRMYGWSEAEALKRHIRELIPEELRTEEIKRLKQLSRKDILEPYRTQRIAKDGKILDVWLTATALLNEVGEVYAIATTERASIIEE
ncbi:chemotaxis protein CheB [Chrysiogenes arsenatis]|uniref:chemotaxis protein CheB n=1 Tax=Chrysiogenes arsenatis TaxID=309797 RepID=UPI00041ADF59|nr:chemotaxis protein CheB [Chrysiogenes arsenatis]